jgi:hypothetical protein
MKKKFSRVDARIDLVPCPDAVWYQGQKVVSIYGIGMYKGDSSGSMEKEARLVQFGPSR